MELSGYAMARYPLTVAQFRVFAEETGLELDESWRSVNRFDNHPVVEVSWQDAKAYCEWLSAQFDQGGESWFFTLPTEAQWEKAALGGDGRIYPWGDAPDPGVANYVETGIGATTPVGCFPSGMSPYGIKDLAGNVFEWCLDDKRRYAKGKAIDPHGEGRNRVFRGGAWSVSARDCRAACRGWGDPDKRGRGLGFRLVRLQGQTVKQGRGRT